MKLAELEDIGLTKSEASVYLALLELGSSATGKITEKSKTSSSKIYEVLDKLMQKGLVSFIVKAGVKHFEAAPPERLLDYMQEKEKKLKQQENKIKKILPELKLKQTLSKYSSEATIYKGMKGLETAFYDALNLLDKDDEVLVLGIPKRSEQVDRFFVKFAKERARRKIKQRSIFNQGASKDSQAQKKNMPLGKIKFIAETTPSAINIFKDRVIIFPETEEPLLIVIDNKQVAESFRVQFETWWNQKVLTYEGREQIKGLIAQTLTFGDYVGFGEGMKIVDLLGEDYFVWWQNEKRRLKIKSKVIMGERYRDKPTATKATAEFKFIPGYENPSATLVFKDKVITINFAKTPVAFLTESKEMAATNKTYFDMLWNQETSIAKGLPAMKQAIYSLIDELGPKEEYLSLGATFGVKGKEKEYANFFKDLHKKRKEQNVSGRVFFQTGSSKQLENHPKLIESLKDSQAELKILPYETDSPVAIYPSDKKTLMVIQEKEPVTITINNKAISESFKNYFDGLWNQEVSATKGMPALKKSIYDFIKGLKPGEDYMVIGATFGAKGLDKEYADFFRGVHKRRNKDGIKARMLFQKCAESIVKKYGAYRQSLDNTNTEYKFLSAENDSPVAILPSEEQTLLLIQKKEPITISIKNKEISKSFKNYFESLWNQDTKVLKGVKALQQVFNEVLEAGHADFIGARGYLADNDSKFIDDWEKRAKQKSFTMRNIVDPSTKDHRITKFSFAKTKYTLAKEFSHLSVFWIYGGKVAISNWLGGEPIIVVIDNQRMYDLYKKQFEYLWQA